MLILQSTAWNQSYGQHVVTRNPSNPPPTHHVRAQHYFFPTHLFSCHLYPLVLRLLRSTNGGGGGVRGPGDGEAPPP
jgi:hypothetical protein